MARALALLAGVAGTRRASGPSRQRAAGSSSEPRTRLRATIEFPSMMPDSGASARLAQSLPASNQSRSSPDLAAASAAGLCPRQHTGALRGHRSGTSNRRLTGPRERPLPIQPRDQARRVPAAAAHGLHLARRTGRRAPRPAARAPLRRASSSTMPRSLRIQSTAKPKSKLPSSIVCQRFSICHDCAAPFEITSITAAHVEAGVLREVQRLGEPLRRARRCRSGCTILRELPAHRRRRCAHHRA